MKPNILYIHTHDTGRYIQPYGHAVNTPHLMNLAKEGVLFRQAFNAGPTCSPSRAGLLLGMCPHSSGMIGLAHRGFSCKDYSKHLASYLSGSGYHTVLSGVQHEIDGKRVGELGYSELINRPSGYAKEPKTPQERGDAMMSQDQENAKGVAEFIRSKSHKDKPFFISFGMLSTHRPFPHTDNSLNPDYLQAPLPMHDNPETRKDMAEFVTMAMNADTCAGVVLQAIRDAGLENNTIVFFTTDHGIAFPKMKCSLYDTGIGVSLIMKVPGMGNGTVCDSLVSHIDIFPTLCELAGLEKPDWLQGESMVPLLKNPNAEIQDEIFSEVTYHAAYEPMRCVRTTRYKYIRYYDDYSKVNGPNIDNGYSKKFLLENGLMNQPHDPAEMLFDLYHDPLERINLIADPVYSTVRKELTARLEMWMQRTDDPLLKGPVAKPAGAIVNKKTSTHPDETDFEE